MLTNNNQSGNLQLAHMPDWDEFKCNSKSSCITYKNPQQLGLVFMSHYTAVCRKNMYRE